MQSERADSERDLFQPLRPAKGTKLVLAALIGPIAWVIAWLVAAYLIAHGDVIEDGLLVTGAAFVCSLPLLGLLAWSRNRAERRFERSEQGREDRA